MAINRRILENTSILAGSQAVAQLANFGFVVVFARTFGADILGEYSSALSLGAIIAVFTSLGSRQLIVRAASQDLGQWNVLYGILLPVQLLTSTIAVALIAVGMWLLGTRGTVFWVALTVCAFQLIKPLTATTSAAFSAREQMTYAALSESVLKIGIFIVSTTLIWSGLPASAATATMPAITLLVVLALYRLATGEFGRPMYRLDFSGFVFLLRSALPFLSISVSSILFVRVGVLMLRTINGAEAVGFFSAVERIVAAGVMLVTMLSSAIFPQLVKLWHADRSQFTKLGEQAQRLILLATLPGATLLTLFSEDLVLLIFGPTYTMSVEVLRIVAWLLVIRGVASVNSSIALAQHRQHDVVLSKVLGLLILVVGCNLLAPRYSATGLAISIILAELCSLSLILWRQDESLLVWSLLRNVARILIACLAAALAFQIFDEHALWIRGLAVLASGISALWVVRAISSHDVNHFVMLIRPHKQT